MKYVYVQGVSFVNVLSAAGVMGCHGGSRLPWGRAAVVSGIRYSQYYVDAQISHKRRCHLKIVGARMMT